MNHDAFKAIDQTCEDLGINKATNWIHLDQEIRDYAWGWYWSSRGKSDLDTLKEHGQGQVQDSHFPQDWSEDSCVVAGFNDGRAYYA
jgi:hypothetical protein